ncbi:hypothetical protein RN001_009981 [Aquatica leii]|uniref:Uncharacterized protein n=1 Tax=Aquatica leii TaxID=1421715 RepID=A0AAN7Q2W1_9COLE|nr:hypothetical protein RN001_009981 [Aquatica leii]
MCTVVLKLHQLQHLDARNTPSNVADTLIFSQTILCNLYKKVGQLHNETELEKTKHKTYFAHICRMKTDYHLMKEQIKKLQNQIEDSCKKKMGTVEKVDVIEEARLKQKLFEFKLSQTNVKSSFERHLRKWNENLKAKKIELKETIKKNTTKVNVLTTLNKEKAELIKILGKQNAEQQHLERVVVVAETCRKSIEKLSEIVKNQNQNIEVLQNEIKRLSYKTVPSSSSKLPDEMLSIRLDTDSARRSLFRFNVWDYKEKQEFVHKKEELPIVSPLNVTEVQIPLVLSDEIEEMVQHIVSEMLESLKNVSQMSKTELKHIVQQILSNMVEHNDTNKVITDLKMFLPKNFTVEQRNTVENTAKKIILLLHPELHLKNIEDSAKQLLFEVIEELASSNEELKDVLENLLIRLVQCLPINFLIQESSISMFLTKLKDIFKKSDENILEKYFNFSKPDDIEELHRVMLNEDDETNVDVQNEDLEESEESDSEDQVEARSVDSDTYQEISDDEDTEEPEQKDNNFFVFGRLNLAGDHQETRIVVTDSVDADDSVVSNSYGSPMVILQNPNEVGEANSRENFSLAKRTIAKLQSIYKLALELRSDESLQSEFMAAYKSAQILCNKFQSTVNDNTLVD